MIYSSFDMLQIMFALIFGCAAVFFSWKIVSTIRRQKAMDRMSRSRIGDLVPGFVHVAGQVRYAEPTKSIISPCSGETCVFYELTVDYESYVDDGPTWARRWSKKESSEFYLEDSSGIVCIRPSGMDLIIQESCIMLERHEAPPEPLASYLQRIGRPLDDDGDKKRVREWRITEGQHLEVFGYATRTHGVHDHAELTIAKRFGWPFYVATDEAGLKDEFVSLIVLHSFGLLITIIASIIVVVYRRVIF